MEGLEKIILELSAEDTELAELVQSALKKVVGT
jgi:hypothetical protein